MSLNLTEFVEDFIVFQNLNVFDVEIGLGVSLKLLFRLTGIYSFENTNTSKVLKTKLEFTDRITPGEIL